MKNRRLVTHLWSVTFLMFIIFSCNPEGGTNQIGQEEVVKIVQNNEPTPVFNAMLKKVVTPVKLPAAQSFAWARQGNKLLIIGGRVEGFHGLNNTDYPFKSNKANTAIRVIDFSDYSFTELPLDPQDSELLQFSSTNMQFSQDGDTLYLVGGYGQKINSDAQSNYTFDRIVAMQVSTLITEVEKGSNGNVKNAILKMSHSPFLQVTGGELEKHNGWFYLLFGQNFEGAYTNNESGDYTCAIRKFKWSGSEISDTSAIVDPTYLHRRDLTVANVLGSQKDLWVGYGGVFTPDDHGYSNPVRVFLDDVNLESWMDTSMTQKTSQYNCAMASIYNAKNKSNIHLLFGGIGEYQYLTDSAKWEYGDNHVPLPFVQTITQMTWQNDAVSQRIQIPPEEPQLPALLGANAIFFAHPDLIYQDNVVDYQKFEGDTTSIGYFYGGIKSIRPTSSNIYPTSLNTTLYEVLIFNK